MRLGQTTAVYFITKLSASVLGFLAMIYFARVLGASVLGIYFLAIGVVSWLVLGCKMGFMTAMTKRVSEAEERAEYTTAGLVSSLSLYIAISAVVYIFRNPLNEYLGAQLHILVILLLGVKVLNGFVSALMRGEHLVHLQGIQNFMGVASRSLFQVILVYMGFNLTGMLFGYLFGWIFVFLAALALMLHYAERSISLARPSQRHFRSLFDYAKYSWVGRLEVRTYSWTDIVVLGFFVPSNLVGIYAICWNISSVMSLFGEALSNSAFPEISETSSKEGKQQAVGYLRDTLAYAGLLTIPGLVGAAVVGRGVLSIYGGEFMQGYIILVILVGAVLLHSYQTQFLNALNAVNRPDLSFKVNTAFIVTNVALNFLLIYLYGWIGAAVATMTSSLLGVILAYWMTKQVLTFSLPRRRIAQQLASAAIMGVTVYGLIVTLNSLGIQADRIIPTLAAVALGGGVYFAVLFRASDEFRGTVLDNLPVDI